MAIRLDQLPSDTQQQILARLEEQGLLVREQPRQYVRQEPASDQPSGLRTAMLMMSYVAAVLGAAVMGLLQASGSDISRSYPAFVANVFVYVVRGCWAIVKDNAVPLSGNLLIVIIFVLGVFKALELAVWSVRKLWPVLVALAGLGIALIVLKLQAA
jgi:lysylphosphatidylglycerol synthetase-like protein (DUF2156 family)